MRKTSLNLLSAERRSSLLLSKTVLMIFKKKEKKFTTGNQNGKPDHLLNGNYLVPGDNFGQLIELEKT